MLGDSLPGSLCRKHLWLTQNVRYASYNFQGGFTGKTDCFAKNHRKQDGQQVPEKSFLCGMSTLSVLALQADLAWHNAAANRAHFDALLATQMAPAEVIVLPEMFTSGFTMEPEFVAETMDGPSVTWMQHVAQSRGALVIGSLVIRDQGSYRNRLVAAHPDGTLQHYDKRHLFRMANEHSHYEAGHEHLVVEYMGWRIRPLVCYDLRFPIWSRRVARDEARDYDLLVYVANWPARRVHHWDALLRARAIENQTWVVGANRVGRDGVGVDYSGGSLIIDPLGISVAAASGGEACLRAEMSLSELQDYRSAFPAWQDADLFEIR